MHPVGPVLDRLHVKIPEFISAIKSEFLKQGKIQFIAHHHAWLNVCNSIVPPAVLPHGYMNIIVRIIDIVIFCYDLEINLLSCIAVIQVGRLNYFCPYIYPGVYHHKPACENNIFRIIIAIEHLQNIIT